MSGLVSAAVALVAALVAAVGWGWRQGRQREADRRRAEAWDRLRAGQDAAGKAAGSGKSPEQIARDNDGDWRPRK